MQKISHTFGFLVSKIQQCLERKKVSVEDFIKHLNSVRGVDNSLMYCHRSLYHSSMDQIESQSSIGDIFPLISGYFSWFNHTPVEKMVADFCAGDGEVKTTYRVFKSQFEEFCVNMITECHKHGFGFERKKDAAKFVVKFDIMESVAKVNELVALRNIIAVHVKAEKQSLYLSSAECNVTIRVVFLLPLFVAEAMFPLTREQENTLGDCGVLQMECGSYHFTSPAWSRERESRESSMGLADSMWYMSMMTVSSGKDLTAAKLEPVLKKELAYLTDGLEGGKHQVVVVMESSLAMLDSPTAFEDFKTTLAYFKAIIKWAVVTSHNNI
jgi:hypothetical protein